MIMLSTILLVMVIIFATSTPLAQYAGGGGEEDEAPLVGAPDKFEGNFYDKIQELIHDNESADTTNLRGAQDRNQKHAATEDPTLYYHVIIQVSGDNDEELHLNKISLVKILKATGAHDIVPADVLSFITARVPITKIPETVALWRGAHAG